MFDHFDDHFDVPEFMKQRRCEDAGCLKTTVANSKKCLECTIEAEAPDMHDEIENILRRKK